MAKEKEDKETMKNSNKNFRLCLGKKTVAKEEDNEDKKERNKWNKVENKEAKEEVREDNKEMKDEGPKKEKHKNRGKNK